MSGIYKRYDNASYATPYQRQQAPLHQQNQRLRIKGVGPRHEYTPSLSDPLISLFQKVHSQAAVHQHSPQDHITPFHTHDLATVNAADVALPPSPITNSSTGIFVDTLSIEHTQRAAKLEGRQGRRELIRAKAREVRLELLALEQLEKEMDSELDHAGDSYNDLDQLFSQGGSPVSSLPSPALAFHGSNIALEPTSGLVRHPPQSPHPDPIHDESSQQFQGFQQGMPPTVTRGVPSRSTSGSGATTYGASPVSKLAVGAVIRPGSGTVTSTPSPTSLHSSPSPPISPLSESYTLEGVIAERDRNTINASTKAQQARKTMGWRPDIGVRDVWDNHPSQAEDDEEDGLHGYLHGSEEDLRDITLSDMMARNLNLLSDSDDSDVGSNSIEKEPGHRSDHDSEQGYDEANMNLADRTCIFMSNLEHDFDQQAAAGQGIPSLLLETLPENEYDFSFMTDTEMPDRFTPIAPRPTLLPPQRNNRDSLWMQPRQSLSSALYQPTAKESILDEFLKLLPPLPQSPESRRSFQSPTTTTAKEAILKDFLRSLPPLPHSPEHQRSFPPPVLETYPVGEQVSPPPLPQSPEMHQPFAKDNQAGATNDSLQAGQVRSARTLPALAPIVTSKEHCQQILQRRKRNSDQRRHMTPHPTTRSQSPLSLTSPRTGSPHSEFSTPRLYDDISSELTTPTSAYLSAKEDFSFSSTNLQGHLRDNNDLKMSLPKRSSGSAMNMSSELIQPPPAPAQQSRRARIEATEAILTGTPRSDGTVGSSWSWSYPSSLQSNAGSVGSASADGQQRYAGAEGKGSSSRGRPINLISSSMGIKIKSRSMSSLTKQQHGWLSFQALDVRMVASGRCHIVVVTRTNQVYSCWETNTDELSDSRLPSTRGASDRDIETALGRSVSADNGAGYVQDTALHPVLVEIDGMAALESPIVKVVCSDSATFLLTEAGDLWGWGCFEDLSGNKIGLLHDEFAARPIQICSHSQRIKDVVCGKNHVLILNAAGDVISWGSNEYGQLARLRTPSHSPLLGEAAFDLSPHFVEILPINILGIGANKTGSFAWDQDQLYAWGDNTFGQLGYESTMSSTSRWKQSISSTGTRDRQVIVGAPRSVALHWKGRSIKQVLGGMRHTVILSTSGLIITLGDDEFGQLGATARTAMSASSLGTGSASPLHSSHSYHLGHSSQSSPRSSVMMNFDGHMSSSSDVSGDGILPAGSPRLRSRRLNPTLVRIGPRVKEISCGDFHTVTCCENGQMYAWGQGFDGVLAVHNVYGGNQLQQSQRGGVPSLGVMDNGSMSPRTIHSDSSLSWDKTRKVVSVSTMRYGVSLALVSSA
ncbi:Ultraviolet-B receptor uvr8 [Linnemannia elongata]|nr:Ultraviolet-B receptor uvr8 [Linnemannia elongata]